MTPSVGSVAERFASFPRGAQELSAARLARDVISALEKASMVRGLKQKELADSLGLTEGRVSQVLNGDGNLRIATLGRFLRALGYEARLDLVPVDPDATPVAAFPAARRQRRGREATGLNACGVSNIPGSQSASWTVLDGEGDVFSVKVAFHRSPAPGHRGFSGECRDMKPLQPAKKELTRGPARATLPADALEQQARLLAVGHS